MMLDIKSEQKRPLVVCGDQGSFLFFLDLQIGIYRGVSFMSRTPHPSRYAIHLLPLEKAYCNRTLFVTIISVFAQQSVRFDDIYISKAWFKTSLLQWENNVREANLASCLRQRWWRRSRRMRCHKHTDKSKFET